MSWLKQKDENYWLERRDEEIDEMIAKLEEVKLGKIEDRKNEMITALKVLKTRKGTQQGIHIARSVHDAAKALHIELEKTNLVLGKIEQKAKKVENHTKEAKSTQSTTIINITLDGKQYYEAVNSKMVLIGETHFKDLRKILKGILSLKFDATRYYVIDASDKFAIEKINGQYQPFHTKSLPYGPSFNILSPTGKVLRLKCIIHSQTDFKM